MCQFLLIYESMLGSWFYKDFHCLLETFKQGLLKLKISLQCSIALSAYISRPVFVSYYCSFVNGTTPSKCLQLFVNQFLPNHPNLHLHLWKQYSSVFLFRLQAADKAELVSVHYDVVYIVVTRSGEW